MKKAQKSKRMKNEIFNKPAGFEVKLGNLTCRLLIGKPIKKEALYFLSDYKQGHYSE